MRIIHNNKSFHKMRRCLVALGAVWEMMIVLAVASPAMAVGQQDQVVSNNAWANEYSWNWSDTVKSSLEKLLTIDMNAWSGYPMHCMSNIIVIPSSSLTR